MVGGSRIHPASEGRLIGAGFTSSEGCVATARIGPWSPNLEWGGDVLIAMETAWERRRGRRLPVPSGSGFRMRPARNPSRAGSPPAPFRSDTVRNDEEPDRLPFSHASVSGSVSGSESRTKGRMRFELELDPDPDPPAVRGIHAGVLREHAVREGGRGCSLRVVRGHSGHEHNDTA